MAEGMDDRRVGKIVSEKYCGHSLSPVPVRELPNYMLGLIFVHLTAVYFFTMLPMLVVARNECDVVPVSSSEENFAMVVAESLARPVFVTVRIGRSWSDLEKHAGCIFWVDNGAGSLIAAISRIRETPLQEMASQDDVGCKSDILGM